MYYTYTYTCTWTCPRMCICICKRICVFACVCVCVCVYMYMYVYMYIHLYWLYIWSYICHVLSILDGKGHCPQFMVSSGHFDSRFYPTDYPHHSKTCLGRIMGPAGSRIRIRFHDMDIEYAENCEVDYVLVSKVQLWWNFRKCCWV